MKLFAIGEEPRKRRSGRRANRLLDALTEFEEFQEYLKSKQKAEKDKAMKSETVKFSFLETVGMCFMLGPWIGIGTLYGIKITLNNLEMMLR
jgi:hypothetical protein